MKARQAEAAAAAAMNENTKETPWEQRAQEVRVCRRHARGTRRAPPLASPKRTRTLGRGPPAAYRACTPRATVSQVEAEFWAAVGNPEDP